MRGIARYTSRKASYLLTNNVVDTGRRTVFGKTHFINPQPPQPRAKGAGWVLVSLVSRVSHRPG